MLQQRIYAAIIENISCNGIMSLNDNKTFLKNCRCLLFYGRPCILLNDSQFFIFNGEMDNYEVLSVKGECPHFKKVNRKQKNEKSYLRSISHFI